MLKAILSTWGNQNVIPSLLQGLQRLELEYGHFEGVGVATLMDGGIQHRHTPGSWQDLQLLLQQQPLSGHQGIAYMHDNSVSEGNNEPVVHFCANERMAIAYYGRIERDSFSDLKDSLLKLGYEVKPKTDCELILHLVERYLELDFPPQDATITTTSRLKGCFAIMALFAKQELLITTRQFCSLTFGVNDNVNYLCSDSQALSQLSSISLFVPEGNPIALHPKLIKQVS